MPSGDGRGLRKSGVKSLGSAAQSRPSSGARPQWHPRRLSCMSGTHACHSMHMPAGYRPAKQAGPSNFQLSWP